MSIPPVFFFFVIPVGALAVAWWFGFDEQPAAPLGKNLPTKRTVFGILATS
jgi:hypothetical protein